MNRQVTLLSFFILLLFAAIVCRGQTSITTLQPAVTLDTNPVCAGSAIDVPFNSSGAFNSYNSYYEELSDSSGNFTTCDTLGQLVSSQDYIYSSVIISGVIPPNVPAGCHYYLRVAGDSPATMGSVWGPFCIQHCDIRTNNGSSIQACMWSCYRQPKGYTDTIFYNIHKYDSLTHYSTNNKFEVQVLNNKTFNAVNTGGLGLLVDTTSGKIVLHLPCPDSLINAYGISPGSYYMRIVATGSNYSDSSFGTVVHLTIGEPSDSIVLLPPGEKFCQGNEITIYANPPRYMISPYNSTYTWGEIFDGQLYQFPAYNSDSISLLLRDTGTFSIICQEDNYGCIGDTTTKQITVEPCTGISTLDRTEQIQIYPNPATDEFTVNFNDNTDAQTLRLFNIMGQELWEGNVEGLTNKQISVTSIPGGVYMLKVQMRDGSTWVGKVDIVK